ncbi:sensor histidine kinase KdpD [Terrihabitans rhizophilus]|uniref:histidine kinase n=1 Tax=Terrihabitans rhizophilus TaxID=3092662 RepID=A0ABU4RIU4_9HYPH|nr:sensor histidine kinase KdpD [Terrihabitans sp. PJ23]MDX6804756.1 sensor histidine kinase KdpD [Terrihabitans sp. PJ23]
MTSPDHPNDLGRPAAPLRGRLKVLLGAAPGVGKTYEMLLDARRLREQGVDVVVGIVETHGRAETMALVAGLEIVPRRIIPDGAHAREEMDLDAILARRPSLVLVDELAHTNVPGSRHPKRYLDVEELLAAGIDVITTLNIQHVESLNDVVARVTRIRVRETVPDAILDRADDIEVVDISPDELIQRLQDGKIYVPEQARRALNHFFSPGNLTALRELALRRTAQRVDEQLLSHMQSLAIRGPWAAGERVLVCVSEDARGAGLIRTCARMAGRFHAPWTALYVETARSHHLSEEERDRVADRLRLAEQLGGEAVTLPGDSIVDEVLAFCGRNNITQIVIGKSGRSRLFEMLHGSVVHDLVRRAGPVGVHVVAGDEAEEQAPTRIASAGGATGKAGPYAVVVAAVAVALGAGKLIEPVVGLETVDLVFLLAVIALSIGYGLVPSLAASVLASLAYNFFFLPPILTFTIASPTNVASFAFFLIIALIVSNLAARVRAQVVTARNRVRTTEALYTFSRKVAAVGTLDDLLWATAYQIASMLRLDVVVLLARGGRLDLRASYPPEDELDDADLGAAKWACEAGAPAGRGSDTLPGTRRLFVPLRAGNRGLGVVGLTRARPGPLLTPDERRLLEALMDQAAIAVERFDLAEEMGQTRLAAETERLRSALLASLSHDLKTPLASILGASTSLRQFGHLFDRADRDDLAATIEEEARRLTRFVGNLLDMTRIDSGAIVIERTPVDMGEVIATALQATKSVLEGHRTALAMEEGLPFLASDAVLLEQVLVNLIENAAKYTPAGTLITIDAGHDAAGMVLRVLDEGPGIPAGAEETVFEKFQRFRARDHRLAGTGLGLAICRGFVEALGGTITAGSRPDRPGAVFTIRFPAPLLLPAILEQAAG